MTLSSSAPPSLLLSPATLGTLLDDGSASGDGNATVLREAADSLIFYLGIYGGLAAANSVSFLSNTLFSRTFSKECVCNLVLALPNTSLLSL